MKVKLRACLWLLMTLPLLMIAQGCPEVDPEGGKTEQEKEAEKIAADPQYSAKRYLRSEYMDVYYYWRDEVKSRNAGLKPYNYATIYDFFDNMLYREDRWSWMCDREDYVSSETGVISGGTWGISLGQPTKYYFDYGLRVRYIYPGSPFEPFGVTRGAWLTHINGYDISFISSQDQLDYYYDHYYESPQTFTFRLVDGRDTTFTTSWATSLSVRSSLITRIFQPEEFEGLTEPVGYFLYLSFKANFLNDIHEAMTTFHDAGIKKLIVDLRYNGGGDSRASQLLVDYLAPKAAEGKSYVVRKHNSYVGHDLDETCYVIPANKSDYSAEANSASERKELEDYWDKVYPNRLDLDELYFIVGNGSASASEMVINGLKPYFGEKEQMVGDTTYGKPNGMYVLMYPGSNEDYNRYNRGDFSKLQWVFLPICFFNVNSLGQSIPWDGFVPNRLYPDDLYHDFGVQENNIKACLTHIVKHSYPDISTTTPTKSSNRQGYRIEMEEDNPRWGLDLVQKRQIF